jgi:hypothetical protein
MITAADVRSLLAQAEFFLRAENPQGAVLRAQEAARAVTHAVDGGPELRAEVALALERLEAAEKAWREEVERRARFHEAIARPRGRRRR